MDNNYRKRPHSESQRPPRTGTCLVEDPFTKKRQPRNYLESLEERVAELEGLLGMQSTKPAPKLAAASPREHSSPFTASMKRSEDRSLASNAGLLTLNATGAEPHYLGSSSAFAFSQVVAASLNQSTSREGSRVSEPNSGEIEAPLPRLLPEYDVGVKLSNAYFENIHPQYPFLHEPTFRLWERQVLLPEETPNITGFDATPLYFINMAHLYGKNIHSLNFAQTNTHSHHDRKLSGLAVRQCIELGYHRNPSKFRRTSNLLQLEMQKRVFWCAYGIDCDAAIKLGRPLCLSLHEVDVEFPLDVNDTDLSDSSHDLPLRNPHLDPPSTVTIAIHVFRLRCLWARIHASLYSDTNTTSPHSRATQIDVLRKDLDTWLQTAPPTPPRPNALSIFAKKEWFELNHAYSILFLYRGMLASKDSDERIFRECSAAAATICHEYRRQYIGRPVNYTWGSVYTLFLAGLTYLHCLWSCAGVRDSAKFHEISSTCTDCLMVLVVIAERWKGAAPYRDILDTLANRTMAAVSEQGVEKAASPTAGPAAGGSFQYMTEIEHFELLDGVDRFFMDFLGDSMNEGLGFEPKWG
ncbi:hypothetical protein N7468_010620 [Penicillium chermesinum]|uniref:Xylanolytic transcriptional activator regulatory domain-containing protein n=1 Tax=Penicillium chermesinum TaxID=63820 RepID=A0A9W9TA30_9EURO|nr:uncharacterized protein N7468_010620 [Penicillium chermesinum]KAJ5214941.1 hypothetical protein N7468_010620 [Penicillium chermesinum]